MKEEKIVMCPYRIYKDRYAGMYQTGEYHPDTKSIELYVPEGEELDLSEMKAEPENRKEDSSVMYLTDNKGRPIGNVFNFRLYLSSGEMAGAVRYNDFTGQIDISKDLPWGSKAGSLWTDGDLVQLRAMMEVIFRKVGRQDLADAVLAVAKDHAYHPIREYFNTLPEWDGTERLDRIFCKYAGADDTDYVRTVTRKNFTACVARVFEPGIKHDEMVILYGGQGIGKSSIFRIMGGNWFCDSLTSFGDKNSMEQLSTAWLIEIPELNSLTKRDSEDVKAFLSKQMDSYRPAYGRYTEYHPRQCVFFGSTNVRECLKDWKNRRFWLVNCDKRKQEVRPNSGELEAERDQIWAEALYRYRCGETLFLDDKMAEVAEAMAEDHRARHPWEDTIADYLSIWINKDDYKKAANPQDRHYVIVGAFGSQPVLNEWVTEERRKMNYFQLESVCTQQIWREALGQTTDMRIQDSKIIVQILGELGWEPVGTRRFTFYGNQRAFRKKQEA